MRHESITAADTVVNWDENAVDYGALDRHFVPYQKTLDDVVFHTQECAGNYLDIGCGTGALLRRQAISGRFDSLVGIDQSPEMLAQGREQLRGYPQVRLEQRNAMDLPDGPFDVITITNVFYTLTDQARFLAGVRAKSGSNTRLVITDPAGEADYGLILRAHYIARTGDTTTNPDDWRLRGQPERASELIVQAFGPGDVADTFIRIETYNRQIVADAIKSGGQYTFNTAAQLQTLLQEAGFVVSTIKPTYASQAHLCVASTAA